MTPRALLVLAAIALLGGFASHASADAGADSLAPPPAVADSLAPPVADSLAIPQEPATPDPVARTSSGLEALVPALAENAYRIQPGPRPYLNRLSVNPAFGKLGDDPLYAIRFAYAPNSWLAYEASLAHDPNHSVHAIFHTFSVLLRRPMPGRLQPFLAAGYGMTVVLPGRAIAADAVTKNVVTAGGGLECFLRDDLALRAEMRQATAFGHQPNQEGMAAYNYLEQTLGLVFYRTLKP